MLGFGLRSTQDNNMSAASHHQEAKPLDIIVGSDYLPVFLGPLVDLDLKTSPGSRIDNTIFIHAFLLFQVCHAIITELPPSVENS